MTSCSDEEIDLVADQEVIQNMYQNRLAFSTKEELENKLAALREPEGLESHLKQSEATGFKPFLESKKNDLYHRVVDRSARAAYPDDEELVSDPFFASLLDENGEMMIGQIVFRTSIHGVFFYNPGLEAEVDQIEQELGETTNMNARSVSLSLDEGIVFYSHAEIGNLGPPVMEITPPPSSGGGGNAGGSNNPPPPVCERSSFFSSNFPVTAEENKPNWYIGDRVNVRYTEGSRRHRLRYFRENWVIYQSAGYNITNLRRSAGIWNRSRADYNELYVKGVIKFKFSGVPDVLLEYSSDMTDRTLIYCGGTNSMRITFPLEHFVQIFSLIPPLTDPDKWEKYKPLKSWETISVFGESFTVSNDGQMKSRLQVRID